MQFFEPQAFVILWFVPAIVGLAWFAGQSRRKRMERFAVLSTLQTKLTPDHRPNENRLRVVYLVLAVIFATLALARPQWGEEKKKIERKGVDIIFLLDTSLSMLAEDVKPNRLEKSKLEIKNLVHRLKGDRIGMVAFAGSSFLQSPLTLDYSAFFLFLEAIKTGYIPDPGTSLARAVRLAIRSFSGKEHKHRGLVIFSDGEDHEGNLEQVLEEAKKAEVRIYTVGTGTAEGEPIPLRDEEGRKNGFKKDREGQVVITKLNRPVLEKIAADTGGLYLPATPAEQEVDVILKHMESLGKQQFKEKVIAEKEDHFQFFLLLALLFLILEMFLKPTRKIPAKVLAMIGLFFIFSGFFENSQKPNNDANKLFQEKKYKSAQELYQKAKMKDPNDPVIRYNAGTTDYQLERYQEAAKEFEKVIATAKDPALKARALYNYGNTQYRLGNFEKSIESYKKALEIDPKDVDAKYNLEFLQNKKGAFDKKNQDRQNQKQDQNQRQNQQQNQQQSQQQDQQQGQGQKQDQQQRGQQENQQKDQQEKDQQQQQNQQDQQQKDQKQQQDQQDQQQKDQQQQQDQQDQQQKDQQQNQQQSQQQKDQQEQQEKDQQKQDEQRQKEQEQQEQQDQQEQSGEDEEKEQPALANEQQQKGGGGQKLQGQMSMQNALQVLDALKEGEKELQDLRRPQSHKEPPPGGKDW